ncbi:hypothetical protein [Geoalkalibacter halelectricus]|uniref:Uncharacterized protein n=1 Tax=Geoalkalibacter halelectricus TaxID=2847045 RepID=A0ABY5ZRQ2_9BACT|nr:hypothetical protein [Geoalkalibacter halelectricus]MDO3376741.1 hypothetical protein [Geoalkalibacter halelectricus]UWZ81308.1 hypothetical protein L9S41_07935 [Geoalkalibacter halelectricus]
MSSAVVQENPPRHWRRWFALLGGGFAWTYHLISIYAVGEFGCVSGLDRLTFAGISAVAWLILIFSALSFTVALAAALIGYRDKQWDARQQSPGREEEGGRFLSQFGFLLSSLFALIIFVETLPVFAYLGGC